MYRFFAQVLLLLMVIAALLASADLALALDPNRDFSQYVARNWSVQDGLPQISVLSLAQDRKGYLWVGTQSGLARFDGARFTNYTPETEPQLPAVWIRSLLVARDGNLWIGTYKGLAVYADDRFTTVPLADTAVHQVLDVYSLAELDGGVIIAATSEGVLRVEGGRLVDHGDGIKPALSLLSRSDGLWIGSNGTVIRVAGGKSTSMPLPPTLEAAAVTRLVEAHGRIWAGTSHGLFVRDGDVWKRYDAEPMLATSLISALYEDHDHNLWIGTNSKLVRLREDGSLESITGGLSLAYKGLSSAYEDREHNLWLGTQFGGLTRLWNGWTVRYSVGEGLNEAEVWSLSRAPDGSVWVGTSDGMSVLENGHFRAVVAGSALPHPHAYNLLAEADRVWIGTRRGLVIWRNGHLEGPAMFAPMATAQINGIVREPDGTLWFPTTEGLFRLDHEGQPDAKLHRYAESDGLADIRARVIQRLRDGRFLVGTQSGLFEMRGERFNRVGAAAGLPLTVDVRAIHQLPSGAIAVGTDSEQLVVFDGRRWNFLSSQHGLPTNLPFFMTEDDRGYLWIAGIRGIERVPLEDIARFGRGEMSVVRGEMLLNERGDRNAGQRGYCCNGAGMSKGYIEGNVLWLPSRDGIVTMDTHGIVKNPLPPEVVIERVQYLGTWHAATQLENELEPDARDLVFEFTVPSFQEPRSVQMRYRLVGYDRAWQELDDRARRRANYTNLGPGKYSFEVMGANNAGVWNPQPAILHFRIKPRFHETWLFVLILATLGAVLAYAAFRFQMRRHERQRAQLEDLVQERTAELVIMNHKLAGTQTQLLQSAKMASVGLLAAGVAHEINNPIGYVRSNLTSLASYVQKIFSVLQGYELLEKVFADTPPELAAVQALKQRVELDYLREDIVNLLTESVEGVTRVQKIVQDLKNFSHVDQAEWQQTNIHDCIDNTLNVIAHELKYRADVVKEYGTLPTIECFPFQIEQVIMNLLMNAAQAIEERGTVTIRSGCEGEWVWVSISDTGKGIEPENLDRIFEPFFTTKPVGVGTGLGLSVSYGIVQRHGGSIEVASALGSGTTFTIRLPRSTRAKP
ncbi:MAG: two-component regulator propeller domain-containing protein [Dokdonella sp.]